MVQQSPAIGALVALIVAIFLIFEKVSAAYGMLVGRLWLEA